LGEAVTAYRENAVFGNNATTLPRDMLPSTRAGGPIRICHLTSVHLPFDTRIFHKECLSLAKDGFDVFFVAPHERDEIRAGVRIVGIGTRTHRLLRMTQTVYAVYRAALKVDACVYHFHDPELMTIALLLKLRGKLVVFDVHEDLPADILSKAWLRNNVIRRFVAALAVWLEKLAGFVFDAIVAATPDIGKRFPASKTEVVRNFPMVTLVDKAPRAEIPKSPAATVFVLAAGHVAGLTRDRCIKELVSAIGLLEAERELWLIGNWESDDFRAECSLLKGFERCKCFGFLPLQSVYGYMKCADIGLSLVRPEKGYLRGIPTKAFEYMALSLPMIMSDFPLWRDLFHECALFVNPLDPRDIAEKMSTLIDDAELRHRLGWAGRRLIERNCSWEIEVTKLDSVYRRLLHIDSDA
jgi:glycosyltransferase involved in cell wall biosynthesis